MGQKFYELYHFQISAESDQEYEENGMRLIGLYSSRALAEAAAERLRHKPGFRAWPDGFRIYESRLDEDAWTSGFCDPYEDHDQPEAG